MLSKCIIEDDELWNVFLSCDKNIDRFYNSNRAINPNKLLVITGIYEEAKNQF